LYSDSLQDIEKAVKASFKISKKSKLGSTEDEFERITLSQLELLDSRKDIVVENKPFTVDVDLVANEDITWIDNVFIRT